MDKTKQWKLLLTANDLTQAEVARRVGVTQQHISCVLLAGPTAQMEKRLLAALPELKPVPAIEVPHYE